MTTKQWIGIEEAAEKYQVSIRRINTWCKRQEITFTEIDHYLMLDENSLLECIERNTQLALTNEEFERRKEKTHKRKRRKSIYSPIISATNPNDASDNKRTCRNDSK